MRKEIGDTTKKKISIGVEDFKEIIDKDGYFVDKTLMIKELIESNAKVTLFTRPRRFGKTLNQFMIRRFFEDEITEKGEKVDNGYLFDGLAIAECGEEILKHRQQYPVIFMSLKSAKQDSYDMAYASLIDEICKEFQRHSYVLQNKMPVRSREIFERIVLGRGSKEEYAKALGFLSECLSRYHGHNAFILIDEYDVPLENAYLHGFYNKMIGFIRSLFESALKTNPYLEKGVITGCLRISKESVFTGLNNLAVESILSMNYPGAFGFTEPEVKAMMEYFDRADQYPELKKWYDGYCLGECHIYNPIAVVNLVTKGKFKSYWSETGTYEAIVPLLNMDFEGLKTAIIEMLGGSRAEIDVSSFQNDMVSFANRDDVLTYLIHLGYLGYDEDAEAAFVPNEKIRQELTNAIRRNAWDEMIQNQRC